MSVEENTINDHLNKDQQAVVPRSAACSSIFSE